MTVIDRPNIGYDDDAHAYTIDGEPVPGVSTIAKVGSDSWGPASWWGWKVGVTGALAVLDACEPYAWTPEELMEAVKDGDWRPDRKRDAAGARGNSVHDALERLAQDGDVPDPSEYPEEERGHVLSLVRWFLHYRPRFVATEVMVGSRAHMYAGRYDIRADVPGLGLCLIDLKTSKGTYPETHFPQLEGYELASVEMGFPPTDGGRWLLRTREDGEFVPHDAVPAHRWEEASFVRSWSTADDFLGYLAAFRAKQRIEAADPTEAWRQECERVLADALRLDGAQLSRDLAKWQPLADLGLDSRAIGRTLGRMRKRGLTRQVAGKRWELVE